MSDRLLRSYWSLNAVLTRDFARVQPAKRSQLGSVRTVLVGAPVEFFARDRAVKGQLKVRIEILTPFS